MCGHKAVGRNYKRLLLLLVFAAATVFAYWRAASLGWLSVQTTMPDTLYNPPVRLRSTESCNRSLLCESFSRPSELIVVVHSSLTNEKRRQALRDTWLSNRWRDVVRFQHVFLLGSPENKSELASLEHECSFYNDMIISPNFIDHYSNLSYKTLEMLQLTASDCMNSTVRYLLKVDDDTMVNVPNLRNAMHKCESQLSSTDEAFIAGAKSAGSEPHRDPKSKYYVPENEYNRTKFPTFVHGPAYLVSMSAVSALLRVVPQVKMLHLEDVYVALLAEAAGVKLLDPGGFHYGWTPTWSYMRALVNSHGQDPQLMRRIWRESL